ncbi:MAG: hypothetical protein ACO1N1_17495 [Dyadobacter fermentans]
MKLIQLVVCLAIVLTVAGCKSGETDPHPGTDLFFTVKEDIYRMYSVKDDIWTNQDDLSSEIRLSFVIDPLFKNKTSNNNLVLQISRFVNPEVYMVGDHDTNIFFSENAMFDMFGSGTPWWEATRGKITVTEVSATGISGIFEGTLVKKEMRGITEVTLPGNEMEIENGEFHVSF